MTGLSACLGLVALVRLEASLADKNDSAARYYWSLLIPHGQVKRPLTTRLWPETCVRASGSSVIVRQAVSLSDYTSQRHPLLASFATDIPTDHLRTDCVPRALRDPGPSALRN